MARVLVVGASGILCPAAAALFARGDDVTGVAQSADGMPDGVAPLVADAREASFVAESSWDSALVYAPAVSDESLATVRAAVSGRVVLVRVSAAADPALGDPDVPADVLQLGWFDEPEGSARWHTPAEVSSAALEVLGDGVGRILGSVRPWSRRPGQGASISS